MVMRGKEVWTETDLSRVSSGAGKHVHFKGKGSSSTTTRSIPAQTQNEATLENGLMKYNTTGLNNASNILNNGINAIGNTVNTDWNSLSKSYNDTMNNVSSGYNDLANGNLPSSYANARQQALTNDMNASVGNAISNLGSRGILNSSVTNNALNNIGQNVSNTLADNYTNDLNTYANILNQQAGNAGNLLSNNAAAEQSSYYKPSALLSYSSQLSTPSQNMYNTMYGGRMGTGSTTQTSNDGGASAWGAVGSLGSAMIACFVGGTKIKTIDGEKDIRDVHIGDLVYSLDDNDLPCEKTVIEVLPAHMSDILRIIFENGTVIETTESQRFYTSPWFEYVGRMEKPAINIKGKKVKVIKVENTGRQDLVYDFVVSDRNIFFANEIAVEGFGD
ncbi:Hint domain-containing protein [Anaerosinus massiliensis]|uniref:Hint domain-containing protein n=1 Tax=Massilibacillus massiliensis TaxID=1806837 RepID=UPI000DA60A9E|nr:Hint domain-containing protein [Massilibacillus massiliensis]